MSLAASLLQVPLLLPATAQLTLDGTIGGRFLSLCMCLSCLLANASAQQPHTKGFSLCFLLWSLRWDSCLKTLSHKYHANKRPFIAVNLFDFFFSQGHRRVTSHTPHSYMTLSLSRLFGVLLGGPKCEPFCIHFTSKWPVHCMEFCRLLSLQLAPTGDQKYSLKRCPWRPLSSLRSNHSAPCSLH